MLVTVKLKGKVFPIEILTDEIKVIITIMWLDSCDLNNALI